MAECNVDPYEFWQIEVNPDGTLTRHRHFPTIDEEPPDSAVFTKDVPLSSTKNTWLRIYRPKQLPPSTPKLPVIIYYHGGGFVFVSASCSIVHNFCSNMSAQLPAVVVSVEYRLAPEHRLPAAYEDAVEAIHWLKNENQLQAAVADHDLSRCFLMGDSAGGNIAYHAGLRATKTEPLKIVGVILHEPFFGGLERTGSELRLVNDQVLPLSGTDLCWELSLPLGSNRDHWYCNPTMVDENTEEGRGVGLFGRCLVTGWEGDPLIDRQRILVKMLEGKGVDVVARFRERGSHGREAFDPDEAQVLFTVISDFVVSSSSS
ncbi:3-O-acetylpapaveroxine carboxylesterase CXE2-like isoform X2 [Macadamia integrifolia]|uniref:3-O-acetylpapaveroxine carboxylesterase CXE2-like isoform X2 n=1 Tax=Macadamia integrifolia TaxID=60698 RepID=UPI001C4F1298|nr:3-O-acetylpapaveroxine carboxylesterase CXE2-like isoform X2 [Macadamia integrifolia]